MHTRSCGQNPKTFDTFDDGQSCIAEMVCLLWKTKSKVALCTVHVSMHCFLPNNVAHNASEAYLFCWNKLDSMWRSDGACLPHASFKYDSHSFLAFSQILFIKPLLMCCTDAGAHSVPESKIRSDNTTASSKIASSSEKRLTESASSYNTYCLEDSSQTANCTGK